MVGQLLYSILFNYNVKYINIFKDIALPLRFESLMMLYIFGHKRC